MDSVEEQLKTVAQNAGFSLVGIAAATPSDGFDRYLDWLNRGYHGKMAYLQEHAEARRRPEMVLANVRSVVMVAMDDDPPADAKESPLRADSIEYPAKVARFAKGRDYHRVIWDRLTVVQRWLEAQLPGCRTRGVTDSAPLLERDFARRAGLGWFGKNTMLINKHRGSFVLLGALLTDAELVPDAPHSASHCGTCTACLEACPTDAFPEPGVLDARKCISYINIEVKGSIAENDRPLIGDWLYGCDVCQDVCPWNRHATGGPEVYDARDILAMPVDEYQRRFRGSTMHRVKRHGLARNAALVLGNTAGADALPALEAALNDSENTVREAAAWAIEQIKHRTGAP